MCVCVCVCDLCVCDLCVCDLCVCVCVRDRDSSLVALVDSAHRPFD